jgi:DNA-binding protein H-NS
MTTLAELIKQKETLDAQIAIARQTELADAISKVKALVAEYGLTQQDVFGGGVKRGSKPTSSTKVNPKFRDPLTGATWAGRGKAPKWIEGKDRTRFAI